MLITGGTGAYQQVDGGDRVQVKVQLVGQSSWSRQVTAAVCVNVGTEGVGDGGGGGGAALKGRFSPQNTSRAL